MKARPESIYDAFKSASSRGGTFNPAASPWYERVGFVVGAPRSGTTWLQQLLLCHPQITTGGESHLFCEVIPAMFENFAYPDGTSHLSTWVSEAELVTAARAFCDAVFTAQRNGTRPDATLVLEKTPDHMQQSALQARVYPDARYVHIIRDGRDSAGSQLELWSRLTTEYTNAARVAKGWADAVRDVRAHFADLCYLELRYEDVVRDTPGALSQIFDHFGLASDAALCEAAAAFGKAPVHTAPNSATVGIRKHAGDPLAERAVARAAGDLLVELGYATADEVARLRELRSRATVLADARDAASATVDRVRRYVTSRGKRGAAAAVKKTQRSDVIAVMRDVADAITRGDDTGLAKLLMGDGLTATELLARIGGWRLTQRRVVNTNALLTFVDDAGSRAVLQLRVDGARASDATLL